MLFIIIALLAGGINAKASAREVQRTPLASSTGNLLIPASAWRTYLLFHQDWIHYSEDNFSRQHLSAVGSGLTLNQETWLREHYRRGESHIIAASLQSEGRRYSAGPLLTVSTFRVFLEFEDGRRIRLNLYDSGDLDRHGNVMAGDGIWSNVVVFNRAGEADLILVAEGFFRNRSFLLQREIGRVRISDTGSVNFVPPREPLWAAEGRDLRFALQVENLSYFEEEVYISLVEPEGIIEPGYLLLEPEKIISSEFAVKPDRKLESGIVEITLLFEAEHPDTVIETERLELEVEILPSGAAFVRSLQPRLPLLSWIYLVSGAFFLLFLGGGEVFYRKLAYPGTLLKGSIFYSELQDDQEKKEEKDGETNAAGDREARSGEQELVLDRLEKDLFKIYIGAPGGQESASLELKGSGVSYTISVTPAWQGKSNRFIRGWQAFSNRDAIGLLQVQCSLGGVLEYNGLYYSSRIIQPGEQFTSGGYLFRYSGPLQESKKIKKEKGIDIFKEKSVEL